MRQSYEAGQVGEFPRGIEWFEEQLKRDLGGQPVFDLVVEGGDINPMIAVGGASDLIVATDSFGAWLAGGGAGLVNGGTLGCTRMVELFTLFPPTRYLVPGARAVTSDLVDVRREEVDRGQYVEAARRMMGRGRPGEELFVSRVDVEKLGRSLLELV